MEKELMSVSQPAASSDMEGIQDEVPHHPGVDEEQRNVTSTMEQRSVISAMEPRNVMSAMEQSNFVSHDVNLETSSTGDASIPPVLDQDLVPQPQEVLTTQSQKTVCLSLSY